MDYRNEEDCFNSDSCWSFSSLRIWKQGIIDTLLQKKTKNEKCVRISEIFFYYNKKKLPSEWLAKKGVSESDMNNNTLRLYP